MSKKNEIWQQVFGYEGLYDVSDQGRIRTYYNSGGKGKRQVKRTPQAVLAFSPDRDGYLEGHLIKNEQSVNKVKVRLHRLVLKTFIGTCPRGLEACHLNGKRNDNRLVNLAWVTHKENCSHKILHGTQQRGSTHPNAILTEKQVIRIKKMITAGVVMTDIAEAYEVTPGCIYDIKREKSWRHISWEVN